MQRLSMKRGDRTFQAGCAAIALAAICGCAAGNAESVDITKPITGDAATNAEKAFRKGEIERKSANFIEATRYYEWVKNNFPYSQYSSLSELSLAEMAYERDDYETAAKAYDEFVKSHPSHPQADFASYRVGLARYNDKASDSFILPPSYEREQTPVKNALDAFNRFLAGYPTSKYVPEAKIRVADCRQRLARHDRYVAEFYSKRKSWKGSAQRWMTVATTYGDLDDGKLRGEAFWKAGQAYREAGELVLERAALQKLIAQAPQDEHRAEAERRLTQIPSVNPAALGLDPKAAPGAAAKPGDAAATTPARPADPAAAPGKPGEPSAPPSSTRPPAGSAAPRDATTPPPGVPEQQQPRADQPAAAPSPTPGPGPSLPGSTDKK